MDQLPATWTALCALAFVLGARHGLDADHLATIDALTRYNARANPPLARRAGTLFSLGHGAVVLAVAVLATMLSRQWHTPAWLEATGTAVSVGFLLGLAVLNVRAVMVAPVGEVVTATGFRGRLLGRFITVRRTWAVAGVGMLFALSFDTISQAALFALAAGRFGGVADAALVALVFIAGMLCVDGVNGLWFARLVGRADRSAAIASRVMALAVAAISAAVGLYTMCKALAPTLEAWDAQHALAAGAAVMAAVAIAFAGAMGVARRRATPAHACSPAGWTGRRRR